MPRFSAFNPFGALRFSSRPSHQELIYGELVKALGGGKNFSDDFDSLVAARFYAFAMVLGSCKYALERAGGQFRPDRTLELLPALEHEYGLVPDQDASIGQRRTELAVACRIARGAKRSNVEAVLDELFGAAFLQYITVAPADADVSTATPGSVGVYARPGTPRAAFRLNSSITALGTPITVQATLVAGFGRTVEPGTKLIVDAGDFGRCEAVTVTSSSYTGQTLTLSATFLKPHNNGTVVATGRHPFLSSNKRHNLFLMTTAAARDNKTRRRLNRNARRLLRAVSTWSITDDSGPFKIGVSRLGVTTIGTIT